MRTLIPTLLLLACEPVAVGAAKANAETWCADLDLPFKASHCAWCSQQSCVCDVRCGEQIFPLECGRHSCGVRLR